MSDTTLNVLLFVFTVTIGLPAAIALASIMWRIAFIALTKDWP